MTKCHNTKRTLNRFDRQATCKSRWIREAEKRLFGRTIVGIRYLTDAETYDLGWDHAAIVLHLDDGSQLFPSADDEGNDAGALFGQDAHGKQFDLCVI